MTKTFTLLAHQRTELGKHARRGRARGLIPAILYGHEQENQPLFLDLKEFRQVYGLAGTSSLVDLKIDQQSAVKVLIHQPQWHHLTGLPIHADFFAVKMDEEIETEIRLEFVGQSPAVEELEGNFVANKHQLTVRCLPAELLPEIEVDISVLKTFDDQIRVGDLKLPAAINIMHEPDEVIALVTAPKSEEELEAELAEDKTAEKEAVESLGDQPVEDAAAEAPDGERNKEQSSPAPEKPAE